MRKGQLEIMGLAIIIILFVLGIMFALSSLVKNQGINTRKSNWMQGCNASRLNG